MNEGALIAVVDDEPAVRGALAELLDASRYRVDAFASGQEFLDSLARRRPACAIVDYRMPGLTGQEVQRCMAMAGSTVPIIIITAHDEPELRDQCLRSGAVDYLVKPLRRDKLFEAIARALARRSTEGRTPDG